ncbi:MAG: acetoacetate--CoA ligase [Pseudomonadota bacterium]
MSTRDVPIWSPDEDDRLASSLTRFCASVGLDQKTSDFADLHRWSIDNADEFWRAVWTHTGIVGAAGDRDRCGETMFDTRFLPDARLNYAANLLRFEGERTAVIAVTETGSREALSFTELSDQVARTALRFQQLGVGPGERVAGCVSNGLTALISMLAATSLGAAWSSCSPDFGAEAMLDRFGQIQPRLLIAASAYSYGGKPFDCREKVETTAAALPATRLLWDAEIDAIRSTPVDAFAATGYAANRGDDPLFIMFSSGTTGAPKCIVHSIAGTLLQHRKEHDLHCDLGADDCLMFYTTCGWMMWNWLVSALAGGTTIVLYDGAPFSPDLGALLRVAEQESVTALGISPGYVSHLAKSGYDIALEYPKLDRLRLILSTGSVLPDESYRWLAQQLPGRQVASISGGTDILGCFALGNPWTPVNAGEISGPGLGMALAFVDDAGNPIIDQKGELVCTEPFPSQPLGFFGDDGSRYRRAYFERYPGVWHHGDFGEISATGAVRIHGRSDAVLNRGGVRIGTAEIYRQLEKLPYINEGVVVAQRWQEDSRIILFVQLRDPDAVLDDSEVRYLKAHIRTETSPRHVPDLVLQVSDVPKTRSGKTVELAITAAVNGDAIENVGALANPESLEQYRNRPELA